MDIIFHLLIAYIISNDYSFIFGSICFDIGYFIAFIVDNRQYMKNPRTMLLWKLSYYSHNVFIVICISIFSMLMECHLFTVGIIIHFLLDVISHKGEKQAFYLPFVNNIDFNGLFNYKTLYSKIFGVDIRV